MLIVKTEVAFNKSFRYRPNFLGANVISSKYDRNNKAIILIETLISARSGRIFSANCKYFSHIISESRCCSLVCRDIFSKTCANPKKSFCFKLVVNAVDTGYPHDGRADKGSYPHDCFADKDSYPHDRHNQYIISSPEPLGSQGELIVYPSSRRPSSVVRRPSSVVVVVNNFKHLLLQNRWADQSQILCGASLGRGNDILFTASGSHDQDGRHAHIW